MKKLLLAAALSAISVSAFAQLGVSINLGDPGFYGQIDMGGAPPPQVVYPQPVIIQQSPGYGGDPVYLHVRPGYERHWRDHCNEYNACGRPVFFVRDDWYNNQYIPYRHRDHGGEGDRHDDHGDHHDHDDRHDDRRDHGG